MSGKFGCLFVALVSLSTNEVFAAFANQTELVKLITSNSANPDQFGTSISVYGNTALISSYAKRGEGAVYEFQRDASGAWHETDEFTFSGLSYGDLFGQSVAHWGDHAVVGAYQYHGLQGGAFIYSRGAGGQWQLAAELDPGEVTDRLGWAADMWGETAVVGAPLTRHSGLDHAGTAYVFERQGGTNWHRTARLTASDAAAFDWFGKSIAMDGNRVIVGAPFDDDHAPQSGAAYVFEKSGASWQQVAKISPADGSQYLSFGSSVALSGDIALIGTNGITTDGAYLFRRDGSGIWRQLAKLTSTHPSDDGFGYDVALQGNLAAVGTFGQSVSLFNFDDTGNYEMIARLVASDQEPDESFGYAVAIAGSDILVGNPADSDGGRFAGATYVFRVPEPGSLVLVLAGLVYVSAGRRARRTMSRHALSLSSFVIRSRA